MSEMPDLSALLSMLSNNNGENSTSPEEMLMALMNSSSTNSSANINHASSNQTTSNPDINMPDMETIMKIMKVMQSTNQNCPSKELLRSLKPFLNDSRKGKVDQYIKILGMTKVFEIFNELGDKQK